MTFLKGVRYAVAWADERAPGASPLVKRHGLKAQQRRLRAADLFDLKPVDSPIDDASTRARRVVKRLLAEEATATAPGAMAA